jgi:hypothetical protein
MGWFTSNLKTVGTFEKKHKLPSGTFRNRGGRDTRSDKKMSNVSWLELKKPGTLSTLRGGQCLGQIIDQPQK